MQDGQILFRRDGEDVALLSLTDIGLRGEHNVENVLAAGRCISADFEVADITRLIPVCWVTGQAAGLAAALCIQEKCKPRNVSVTKLQNLLKQQGAYLG